MTYDVVIFADNTGGKLLPGMTANATIDVASAPNALTVPLAALHTNTAATTPWGNVSGTGESGAIAAGSSARLFVDRNGRAIPMQVYVRLTNGAQAAVEPLQGNTLAPGDPIVIGTSARRTASQGPSQHSPIGSSPMGASTMRGIH